MENKSNDSLRNSTPSAMNTLMEVSNSMIRKGYTENFSIKGSKLYAPSNEESFTPDAIDIVNFFRFEGPSNPEDNAILYVIETKTGLKGTLTDAYGPYADGAVNDFIKAVESIAKKTEK